MIEVAGGELRLGKGDRQSIGCPEAEDYADEFIESMREKRRPSCTGCDGRASVEAALDLRRSEEKDKAVKLPLIE